MDFVFEMLNPVVLIPHFSISWSSKRKVDSCDSADDEFETQISTEEFNKAAALLEKAGFDTALLKRPRESLAALPATSTSTRERRKMESKSFDVISFRQIKYPNIMNK